MTSSPTPGHQPWGQVIWNESWPSRVPMVQIWMLSDEWLSRYELLENLKIKLCRSVKGTRTRTWSYLVTIQTYQNFMLVLCLITSKFVEDQMKALTCPQHFRYYKSKYWENVCHSRASNSREIWPKIKLFQDFMPFLVTSKTEKDPIKKEGAIASTTFFSIKILWEKCSMSRVNNSEANSPTKNKGAIIVFTTFFQVLKGK